MAISELSTTARWIGFDLGGTKMLATVYDEDFRVLGRKRKRTKGQEGVEAGIARMIATIADALAESQVSLDQVGGIGVGCPGPLDLNDGVILNSPNLGWQNAPIKKSLEKHFNLPAVIVNDVDAGMYGEYRFGAAAGSRCALGVFPGTGIGGGCVYEGRILRGQNRSCMEIGHLQVMPDGPLCGCGKQGCLETVASRLAVAAAAAKAAYRGQAPNLFQMAGADIANIRSGVLAAAIKAGDEVIERIVRDAAGHIGIAVAGVINLLAPDIVVLGGGLVEAMPDLFVKSVAQAARNRVMPTFIDSFKVKAAQLGDDATALGAAAWACEMTSRELAPS